MIDRPRLDAPGRMDTPGERVRTLRQARGWSLQQLADRTGASKPQIDKLERGTRRMSDDWARRIADALDVAPETLAGSALDTTADAASPQRIEAYTKPSAMADTQQQAPAASYPNPRIRPDTRPNAKVDTERMLDTDADVSYPDLEPRHVPVDTDTDARELPLRGFGRFSRREGRQTGVFVEAGQAPERVWCPEPLAGVTGAYAVRMPDGSMAPKYEAGQLLFVHPYRTPRSGDAVVVRLADGTFAVGRLRSPPDRTGVRLSVLCPADERRFDAERVAAVERIVFAEEP